MKRETSKKPAKKIAKKAAPKKSVVKKKTAPKKKDALTAKERQFIADFWAEHERREEAKREAERNALDDLPFLARIWHNHRQLVAWIGFSLVVMVGFFRIETAVDEERRTRQEFDAAEDREEREELQEALEGCQIRNFSTRNGRERDVRLFDALSVEFPTAEQVQSLREALLPEDIEAEEDRDCDGDGKLTEKDYYSR